jgi:hypothetical protein
MYPPVTQFETRRLRLERELQAASAKVARRPQRDRLVFLSRVAARWTG